MSNSNGSDSSQDTKKVLLQVSGSIAAFKSVALASMLVKAGFEVEVVMTASAQEFIGPASFEGLTGKRVHTDVFESGSMMSHINLERWADLILLYPATANQLAQLAQGLGSDLVSTLFLAHEFKKPYWIAPAMNQGMWAHPAVRENASKLARMGVQILDPAQGRMACGEQGSGRLIEPEDMLERVQIHFESERRARQPLALTYARKLNILVTAGGTQEPIDPVRSITNVSTGRTGFTLAKSLEEAGHEVTLVQSESSQFQDGLRRVLNYTTTDSMARLLEEELSRRNYDLVIHSAAVSDFRVEEVSKTKISSKEGITLRLIPNPKLVARLKDWSRNKNLKVISFKLTSGADHLEVLEQLSKYDSDWIIHNELSDVGPEKHTGVVFAKKDSAGTQEPYQPVDFFKNKQDLSAKVRSLVQTIAERQSQESL